MSQKLVKPVFSRKSVIVMAIAGSLTTTACSSTQNNQAYATVAQNAVLGAAVAAVTQVNGNSKDIRDAATVGALLGILGGISQ